MLSRDIWNTQTENEQRYQLALMLEGIMQRMDYLITRSAPEKARNEEPAPESPEEPVGSCTVVQEEMAVPAEDLPEKKSRVGRPLGSKNKPKGEVVPKEGPKDIQGNEKRKRKQPTEADDGNTQSITLE